MAPRKKYILFIVPPQEIGYGYINDFFWQQGILYLASFLIKRFGTQIEIDICDGNIRTLQECKNIINSRNYDLIGFHCVDHTKNYALELAHIAYQKGCPKIIFGGAGPIFGAEQYLNSQFFPGKEGIIGCCIDSGEFTLQELLLEKPPHDIPNFIYIDKKDSSKNLSSNLKVAPRPSETEYLTHLPFEVYNDIKDYLFYQMNRKDYPYHAPTYSALSHEGCIHRLYQKGQLIKGCSFCGIPAKQYTPRPIKKFWQEIQVFNRFCKKQIGFELKSIKDWGDSVNLSLLKNMALTKPTQLKNLHYSCYLSIAEINKDTCRILENLNCFSVYIGIDGSNEDFLKRLKKSYSFKDIMNRLEIINKINLQIEIGIIIGAEGETQESLNHMIKFSKQIKEKFADRIIVLQGNVLIPMPGSEVFQKLREKVIKTENKDPIYMDVQERIKRWLKYFTYINWQDCINTQKIIETISPRKHSYAFKKNSNIV